ncbi:MAG: hypothetical protein K8T10_04715 [Candidatus Eremiobacteraeota bacterium]|nr:hypothetical protein [Candidatus Eremiobacteraeota bacterium]
MPDEEKMKEAMTSLGRALKTLTKDEKLYLKELKGQIDAAVEADPSLDKQMEFCYGVIFAPDKIKNQPLMKAAKWYIKVAEE